MSRHRESELGPGAGQGLTERRTAPLVRVLECDPELGLRVPAAGIARARHELVATVQALPCGVWEVPDPCRSRGLGLLVLDGLLARDLTLADTTATELIGEGDVLQPVASQSDDGLVRYRVLWHVLEPLRIAVLDEAFARSLGHWPPVMSALLERALKRTLRMSIHQALLQLSPVETRLLVLFWYLAERWGRVTPQGISLRLRLSHQVLGQLVGCQRASVTTALRHVAESGRVVRRSDRSWLLRGEPPDHLHHLYWQASGGEGGASARAAGAPAVS